MDPARVRLLSPAPVRRERAFVLYWMVAARRTRASYALEWALGRAKELRRPLVVLEALRAGYPWASDRLHAFVLDGMRDNAARFRAKGIGYHAYVEPEPGAGKGLLAALARHAAIVVTDDWPCFFVPRMLAAAARALDVRLEAIDGNGVLPMRAADRTFTGAYPFRRWAQKLLRERAETPPKADPLARLALPAATALPREITRRWPARAVDVAALPIDHAVAPAPFAGGERAGREALRRFVARALARYLERDDPDAEATSGLSPWLHFGHVGAWEVLEAVTGTRAPFARISAKPSGQRDDWGIRGARGAFVDQLVTWRELGFNMCATREDYMEYHSLPAWARATLEKHARDPRPRRYSHVQLAAAETYDELWNAAQRQLVREGRIHNYMRMLWGKKILEWSAHPEEALAVMIALNDKYAVDGRDPNSYSGIFWCLGRYDRAWGPERPIFGTVRYMSSESARRKLRLRAYLQRYRA